jgi:hypothetical protein
VLDQLLEVGESLDSVQECCLGSSSSDNDRQDVVGVSGVEPAAVVSLRRAADLSGNPPCRGGSTAGRLLTHEKKPPLGGFAVPRRSEHPLQRSGSLRRGLEVPIAVERHRL